MQTGLHQNEQIQSALVVLDRHLGDALLGVYLHGSAVSGGLKPQSDVDLLAVVEAGLTDSQRKGLLKDLLRLSARHPSEPSGPRCLEVIVFCQSDLGRGDYPARTEFVYGEWLREAFEAGVRPMPDHDPEYSLVLAQARQEATALRGPSGGELLPAVPPENVRRAMRDALSGLMAGLDGDERNVLLTLARMWYTASTGEFVTKDAAAQWAIARLPSPDAMILDQGRRGYLGEITDDWFSCGEAARQLAVRLKEHVGNAL